MTKEVERIYSAMEKVEASLGGGGGFEGFYGSVTAGGLSRVYKSMKETCSFAKDSFLVDIGGGLGRPLMHAVCEFGLQYAIGIEVDEIKCMKSESVIRAACRHLQGNGHDVNCTPLVLHRDIEQAIGQLTLALQVNIGGTLEPATHAYSFWEGVPAKCRCAFGELVARSSTIVCVTVVQRSIRRKSPVDMMAAYKFGDLQLMEALPGIHMSGSQRTFTAYVFKRTPSCDKYKGPAADLLSTHLLGPRCLQVTLPRMLRSHSARANIAVSNHQKLSQDVGVVPARVEHSQRGRAAGAESKECHLKGADSAGQRKVETEEEFKRQEAGTTSPGKSRRRQGAEGGCAPKVECPAGALEKGRRLASKKGKLVVATACKVVPFGLGQPYSAPDQPVGKKWG